MADTAERVARGDLSQRVNLAGPADEVRRLARTFDTMTAALERAFADLAATDARTRQFIADASHELRTPLTAVAAYADILLLDPGSIDTEERLRRLAALRREVGRTQRMVDGLLALLDTDGRMNVRPVALRAVCETVAELVRPLAGDRVLRVHGSAFALADEDRVRQILLNLLTNAVRHTDAESGRIGIRLSAADGTASLSVADNGCGMDEHTRSVAFERFSRGTAPVGEGSGLGLAIVASVVRALDGQVRMDSTAGHGTTVVVRLPAAQQATDEPAGSRMT